MKLSAAGTNKQSIYLLMRLYIWHLNSMSLIPPIGWQQQAWNSNCPNNQHQEKE